MSNIFERVDLRFRKGQIPMISTENKRGAELLAFDNPRPREAIFIEPTYAIFHGNRLFDGAAYQNPETMAAPFLRLYSESMARNIPVYTADFLHSGKVVAGLNHYWSLGSLDAYKSLLGRSDVRLRGFILFEPPLVSPQMYRALPEITRHFEAAYIHNTIGDGYSLNGVDKSKLRKLYWPQPFSSEVEPYWSRGGRLNKLVVIASNHNPRFRRPELYSLRIRAIAELVGYDAIDLFGRGWDRWWSKQAAWPAYWWHRNAIMQAYRGSCESKFDVLSRYRFCLCFENMPMSGYLTEKLFDCFYAGTVPLYLGAPNIENLVPPDSYIDVRQFASFSDLYEVVSKMPENQWQAIRDAGRDFLRGARGELYYKFMTDVCSIDA